VRVVTGAPVDPDALVPEPALGELALERVVTGAVPLATVPPAGATECAALVRVVTALVALEPAAPAEPLAAAWLAVVRTAPPWVLTEWADPLAPPLAPPPDPGCAECWW
jgi:hypothetical protein